MTNPSTEKAQIHNLALGGDESGVIKKAQIREFRYERKFRVEELDARQIRILVKRHPRIFYAPYPPRHVNNLYLDTAEMGNYHANVSGDSERHKVRIRWYGGLLGEIKKPVLEFKVKEGLVGGKYSYTFPAFSLDAAFSQDGFQKLIRQSDLPDPVRWHLRDMNVVLCNRYYRWYYVTKDGKYRVTVDSTMTYFQVKRANNYFRHKFLDPKATVVELKYARELDPTADKVASFFPFRTTRNSKYMTGIEQIYLRKTL